MKKIDIKNLVEIEGGTVSQVIGGVCVATAIGRAVGYFTPTAPVAWAVTIGCAVNAVAGNQGWW